MAGTPPRYSHKCVHADSPSPGLRAGVRRIGVDRTSTNPTPICLPAGYFAAKPKGPRPGRLHVDLISVFDRHGSHETLFWVHPTSARTVLELPELATPMTITLAT